MRAVLTQREEIGPHGGIIDSLEHEYVEFLNELGFDCYPMSNSTKDVDAFFQTVHPDLVLLTGGGIIQDSGYTYPVAGRHQVFRDTREDRLIGLALEEGTPLMGICRGMQKLNAYFDGFTSAFSGSDAPRVIGELHPVRLEDGNILSVNHYHKDGIYEDGLMEDAHVVALDPSDACIEAFKAPGRRVAGVQWHPERLAVDDPARRFAAKMILDLMHSA